MATWFQESVPLIPSTFLFFPIPSHCQWSCYEKKQWPTHLDVSVLYWATADCIQVAWPSPKHGLWTALSKLRCQSITVHMLQGHSRSKEYHFHINSKLSTVQEWPNFSHFKMTTKRTVNEDSKLQSFLTIPMYHFWPKCHRDKLRIFFINWY